MIEFFFTLGRVGVEPQIRGTEDHPVIVFSLATNVRYKKGNEYLNSTDWHNIAVFRPGLRDSIEKYVSKGEHVLSHSCIRLFLTST